MKKFSWMVTMAVLFALVTLSASAYAENPRTIGPADGKSAYAQCLANAGTCKAELEGCNAKLAECNAKYDSLKKACDADNELFDQLAKQCTGLTGDQYKDRIRNKKPVSYSGQRAPVQLCTGDAKLVNGRCDCSHVPPLPGGTVGAEAVKVQLPNGDQKWDCVYPARAVNTAVTQQQEINKRICAEADQLSFLADENPDNVDAQASAAAAENLCEQTGKNIAQLVIWAKTAKGQIRKLQQDMIEMQKSMCVICGCSDPTKSIVDTCSDWITGLRKWQKKVDRTLVEHDKRLTGVENRVTKLETRKGFDYAFLLGADARYVARFNANIPDSTQFRFTPGFEYWAWPQFALSFNGAFGYSINKWEDKLDLGLDLLGKYAFSSDRTAMLVFGIVSDWEIVARGTDAVNVGACLGFEGRPMPGLSLALLAFGGESVITVIDHGVRDRMTGGGMGGVALRISGVLPGSSDSSDEKSSKKTAYSPLTASF